MRLNAHSLRLAVSFLLGAVFVAPPMVSAASPAPLESLFLMSPVSQTDNTRSSCKALLPETQPQLYSMLVPARFERVDTADSKALIITAPKDTLERSFASSKTVLKKVETKEDEVISATSAPSLPVLPVNTTAPKSIDTPADASFQAPLSNSQVTTASILSAEVLFNLVNQYRVNIGLSAFQKDERVCAISASRAPEIDREIYGTDSMHAGFFARNLPYFATETIISTRTEQGALIWWLNSPVHRSIILGNYTYACLACAGRSCNMTLTNFEPKVAQPSLTPPQSPVTQ